MTTAPHRERIREAYELMVEVDRHSPTLESRYAAARAACLEAGHALNRHRGRVYTRALALQEIGQGAFESARAAEFRLPDPPAPVSAEDLTPDDWSPVPIFDE